MSKKQVVSSERNKKIREYLISNQQYLNKDFHVVANIFETTSEIVRHQARNVRNLPEFIGKEKSVEEFKMTDEVEKRRENGTIISLKKQLENAIKDYTELSDKYDVALAVKTSTISQDSPVIIPSKSKDEATAIIQISDCHFGKKVVPSTVNGLNEHTPEIAGFRMDKLGENSVKLIKKEQANIDIPNFLLILGGDFIENSQLHAHSEMSTSMSPMEEVIFARELLAKYIRTVTDNIKFKKVIIACVRGNHPRITKKMVAAVDYRMNYEHILYNILKQDFKDSRFEWYIPDSEIGEVEIYGRNIRIIHGHQCKFGGGIGGLTIPLNKLIMRLDQTNPAYHTFLHHFHTLSYPTKNSTLNGSVVGYDPYAFSLGLSYEEPQQSFQLLDRDRGMTIKAPIFCY